MTTRKQPPAFATWLLKRLAGGNEALIGDLLEEYRTRQSRVWYWRQVMAAVAIARIRAGVVVGVVAAVIAAAAYLPIPGAHAGFFELASRAAGGNSTFSSFLPTLVPGWQLSGVTIFALGIMPYVSAAFIVQLAALFWRLLSRGNARPLPIVTATWCIAIGLSVLQAVGLANFLERVSLTGGPPLVDSPDGWSFRVTMAVAITLGTAGLMFVSDQITRRRIGNGMFIVFVAAVLAASPTTLQPLLAGMMDPVAILSALALNAAMVGVISHFYRRAVERELLA